MSFLESFVKALKFVREFLLAPITLIVSIIPGTPAIVNKILEKLPALIQAMEQALPESGQGALKKAGVMATAKAMFDSATDLTTGGAHETWETYRPVFDKAVDTMVAAANAYAPGVIVDEEVIPGDPGESQ